MGFLTERMLFPYELYVLGLKGSACQPEGDPSSLNLYWYDPPGPVPGGGAAGPDEGLPGLPGVPEGILKRTPGPGRGARRALERPAPVDAEPLVSALEAASKSADCLYGRSWKAAGQSVELTDNVIRLSREAGRLVVGKPKG